VAAALGLGTRNVVGDIGERIRLAGFEHPVEGIGEAATALALIGKQVEDVLPYQFLATAHGRVLIGPVRRDVSQVPVEDHVRVWQGLEDRLEIWNLHFTPCGKAQRPRLPAKAANAPLPELFPGIAKLTAKCPPRGL